MIKIIEYQNKYNSQLKKLLYETLKYVGFSIDKDAFKRDSDLDKIEEIYKGRGRFWLALENDKVIGMVGILELDKLTAKLRRMFVFSKYHGTGLGQKLLDRALEFARQQGYKKIVLDTHELMHRAHRFYEKNGFKKVGSEGKVIHYELTLD